MKNNLYKGLFFIAILIFAFISCRKDADLSSPNDYGTDEINKLAEWYNRQLSPSDAQNVFTKFNKPEWKNTKVIYRHDTTFFTTLLFKNGTVTRELQVTLTNNVYQGNIRQYDFKKADSIGVYSLSINGRILDLGYFSKQKYVFIGKPSIKNRLMMSMEDTDGDGVIDGGNIDGPTITAPSPSPSNPFPFPIIPPTYPTNPSMPPPPPPSFPPLGGGGSGGGVGDEGGYVPARDIIDSVKNPCIKAQLTNALTAKTTIRDMLNETFGDTVQFESLNLTFTDVTNLPDTIAGNAGRASATSIYFDIRLNANKLPDYSQEYILSTIYHEILHAYMYSKLTKGSDGKYNISTQHEDMANKYLILMTGALKIAFPNISSEDAWALSWGGLEETNLYTKKLTQTQRDEINEVNRKYTNKSTSPKQGTYCN